MLTRKFQAMRGRKSQRGGQRGRELELRVAAVLAAMLRVGSIDDYVMTAPNSADDQAGVDFIVRRGAVEVGFGVTISAHRWNCARLRHPGVATWWIPFGMKDASIAAKVLALLRIQREAA